MPTPVSGDPELNFSNLGPELRRAISRYFARDLIRWRDCSLSLRPALTSQPMAVSKTDLQSPEGHPSLREQTIGNGAMLLLKWTPWTCVRFPARFWQLST